jgi:hypothetical protein
MMSLEIEESYRQQVREFLFPPINRNLLSRQIFELVHYGHFTYEAIMAMPISKRRRMYYLLVKYSERDRAVANGNPAPPIDVSDVDVKLPQDDYDDPQEKIEKLVNKVKRNEKSKSQGKKVEEIPTAIREALERLKDDGFVNSDGELIQKEDFEEQPKLVAPRKKLEIPDELQKLLSKVQKID